MYKKFKSFLPAFTMSIIVSGAMANQQQAGEPTLARLETKAPHSDYKPAFTGQTRVAGVKTKAAFEGKLLSGDLKSPWGIAMLPDGRFLITEKRGQMRIATPKGQVSEPITG